MAIPGSDIFLQESDLYSLIGRLISENNVLSRRLQVITEEYAKLEAQLQASQEVAKPAEEATS